MVNTCFLFWSLFAFKVRNLDIFLRKGFRNHYVTHWYKFLQSLSTSLPQKYVDHLSEAADQRGKYILNEQVEGKNVFYKKVFWQNIDLKHEYLYILIAKENPLLDA